MDDKLAKILIVDDEQSMCEMLTIMLSRQGYEPKSTSSGEHALKMLDEGFDLVITDLKMPDIDGIQLLEKIRKKQRDIPVIVMTAYTSLTTAVGALRHGAFDYIAKPFQKDLMSASVERALENSRLKRDNRKLRQTLEKEMDKDPLDNFVGSSPMVNGLKSYLRKIAPTDTNVLITGESGTGKDVLAKAIHKLSQRREKPFIAINCGALPETLLESELFGYEKGAFTGASKKKMGLLKAAEGGTFFLDEIGETSPAIQVKLLRAIENRTITPVGSTQTVELDVRIIAATNADLESMTQTGDFRSDLYYRLKVFHVDIPPLRDRREDILPITQTLLKRLSDKHGLAIPEISEKAKRCLVNHRWEGNVRELDNALEQALVLSGGKEIEMDHLPGNLCGEDSYTMPLETGSRVEPFEALTEMPTLEIIEKAYIFWTLNNTEWKKSDAAKILGIDASTLYRKIDRYQLKKPE